MIALGTALAEAFAGKWDPEARQSIDDVLDAAHAWRHEGFPLDEAAKVGELADFTGILASAARTQCRAMMSASLNDPRRASLKAMLDALIARQPGVVLTSKGIFTHAELHYHGVTVGGPRP